MWRSLISHIHSDARVPYMAMATHTDIYMKHLRHYISYLKRKKKVGIHAECLARTIMATAIL